MACNCTTQAENLKSKQDMSSESVTAGIVNFDFQNVFPHKFWISNWITDDSYSNGVCYKILSVRDEQSKMAQLVLVRSFRDGSKEILRRAEVPLIELETAAHFISDRLTKELGLNFEEQNFQMARTLNDFNRLAAEYGWSVRPPDSK
jgi:hypothetical protein